MVLISYDFDFRVLKYYKEGLNVHTSPYFSALERNVYPQDTLLDSDVNDSTIALGVGKDSVSIIDSDTMHSFVLEPCSSVLFILKMNECLDFFNAKKNNGAKVIGGGIVLFENIFRMLGPRGVYELDVLIDFEFNDIWEITFRKNGSNYKFRTRLDDFLKEFYNFILKCISFNDLVVSGFRNTEGGRVIVDLSLKYANVLENEMSNNEKTFYDYM